MVGEASLVPAFGPALPEIVLALACLVSVVVGALRGDRALPLIEGIIGVALVAAVLLLLDFGAGRVTTFNSAFVVDHFARFMKVLTLVGALVCLVLSRAFLAAEGMGRFEFPILIGLSTIGMMIMVSANEMISLYLGVELQSLALYVLASLKRDNVKASEAGLKYFVLGALSSGMLLYGMSLVYGFTGSVTFATIAEAVEGAHGAGVVLGLVFILAGLAFKMSAVPFHMWTPDVYEGAPTPVTAFFASAPKMAAVAITTRMLVDAFGHVKPQWQPIIVFVAIASMGLGAFGAIGQSNLKRLMAYSSIGNMGYALVGVAAGSAAGVEGVAVFMAIYLAMTLGVFACLLALEANGQRIERIEDLAGLSQANPGLAFVLATLMFSLIGIPPLAGFFGKFYVFAAAIEAKLFALAVIGMLASVVSAYYYLRIVKLMYLDPPRLAVAGGPAETRVTMWAMAAFVLLFFAFGGVMKNAAHAAAASLF